MDRPTPIEEHQVPGTVDKSRLQEYAVGRFMTLPSRKATKKAIKAGRILVDGKIGTTAYWITGGELLELLPPPPSNKPELDLGLRVLFEDQHLAVVYKPAGLLVSGNRKFTVQNGLKKALTPSMEPHALEVPEPIHRLDYPTTGALVIGKTATIVAQLNKLFELQEVEKTYWAVVQGKFPNTEQLQTKVDGKEALTHCRVLQQLESTKYDQLSLLELQPKTGRRHQLRQQLYALGTPIFGDRDYFIPEKQNSGNGLYLHALSIRFLHPETNKEVYVHASPPEKFGRLFPYCLR